MARNAPTPADTLPEDRPELGMDDAALGTNATGLYFTKAPRIEAWHAFTQEHEPVGMVLPNGTAWGVKIGRALIATTFSSATAARAYLMGWHDRDVDAALNPAVQAAPAARPSDKPEGGYDATASTTITA
jgi:hypothetical protein